MILNPAIIALIGGSLLLAAFAVYAAAVGAQILRHWDIESGSEQQLALEKKTYLVSSIWTCLMLFEMMSMGLFVYTGEHLHGLFVGAMCAAGSLNVNDYGYVTLFVKLAASFLCGIWLIVNHVDNRARDYPLIRPKYRFVGYLAALLVVEAVFQTAYFTGLEANIITSCCGTLFSEDARTITGEMSALPPSAMTILFFLGMALVLRTGIHFLITGRAAGLFSAAAAGGFVLGLLAVISFISVYFYELPTHHCPFCILQKEYGYIGYPLYLALFLGGGSGASAGVLHRLKGPRSLEKTIPRVQKKLCVVSLCSYAVFTAISVYPMLFSDFTLRS